MHRCPKVTPGTPPVPHVGGPVLEGCPTVLIEGQPAAREGDSCFCFGEPDKIVTGSSGVYIGEKPAARKGDQTAHGGSIKTGSRTVLIGEKKVPRVLKKPALKGESEDIKELSPEEKISVINEAIENSIVLLEKKLQLLEQNDLDTLISFKTWFGQDDEGARMIILERIRKALEASKKLSVENFEELISEKEKRETCAIIYSDDSQYRIKVGSMFWKSEKEGEMIRSGTIIHELSHFENVGGTEDVLYGEKDCLELARIDPNGALNNADSFQLFVFA
jgi:uncharacterized Zn-binding protein involved in type VI secretion